MPPAGAYPAERILKMAHNIAILSGRNAVFTGRGIPAWHKLGTTIQGVATWREAMDLAGLSWTVEKRVLYDNAGQAVPAWGIFRNTDNVFLGVVGERYQSIQNHDAFEFVDALIGNEGAHYDSAGALGNGEVIFCSAHLPSAGFEVVPGDAHNTFLLFKTSHDGSMSATCKLTDVRAVCQNTLTQALNGGGQEIKIKHTANAANRMNIATKLVASGKKTADQIRDKMRILAQKKVTRPAMEDIFKRLFPGDDKGNLHTKTQNNISDILSLYEYNDNNAFPVVRGTAYNFLNACTEYADKVRTARGGGQEGMDEARATSALFGSGDKFKSDAFDYIYQAAGTMPGMAAPIVYGPGTVTNSLNNHKSRLDMLAELVEF
jgi:phage/plasmid-like protein (TIGR03299 family)